MLREHLSRPLLALMAMVAVLLLLACVNASPACCWRVAPRAREMALRVAVGASRWRLWRQVLAESLLAVGGGGSSASRWPTSVPRLLVRILLSGRQMVGLPAQIRFDVQADVRVLLFTVSRCSGHRECSLEWFRRGTHRPPLLSTLRDGGIGGAPSRRLVGRALVVRLAVGGVVLGGFFGFPCCTWEFLFWFCGVGICISICSGGARLSWGWTEIKTSGEDTAMRLKHQWWSGLVAAVLGGLVGVTAVAAAGAQFLPVLSYPRGGLRSGADTACQWLHRLCDPPQRARWRHQRRAIGLGRVRNRLGRHPRRGVLRAPESQGAHGGGGVSSAGHPAHLCPDGAGHARPDPPAHVGFGRADAADGRVFPYVFTPRSTGGVRTRPSSGSSANGLAAWSSSRA